MDERASVLCVDDEKNDLTALARLLQDEDFKVFTVSSGKEGLEVLAEQYPIQVVVSDYRMPQMDGIDFLKKVCKRWPETIRIVISGYADTASVVSAINEGLIYKFIPKPWNDEELKITIRNAINVYRLNRTNEELTVELKESNEELRLLNENLESLVQDRANELIFQNKILVRSQFILDALPVGILGVDDAGQIVQCNRKCEEILAKESGKVIGEEIQEILPQEAIALVERINESGSPTEWTVVEQERYKVKGAPLHSSGGQEGVVLVFDYK